MEVSCCLVCPLRWATVRCRKVDKMGLWSDPEGVLSHEAGVPSTLLIRTPPHSNLTFEVDKLLPFSLSVQHLQYGDNKTDLLCKVPGRMTLRQALSGAKHKCLIVTIRTRTAGLR